MLVPERDTVNEMACGFELVHVMGAFAVSCGLATANDSPLAKMTRTFWPTGTEMLRGNVPLASATKVSLRAR